MGVFPTGGVLDTGLPFGALQADAVRVCPVFGLLRLGIREAEAQGMEALACVAAGNELPARRADMAAVMDGVASFR